MHFPLDNRSYFKNKNMFWLSRNNNDIHTFNAVPVPRKRIKELRKQISFPYSICKNKIYIVFEKIQQK
jgi:hypothetical protein